MKQQDVFYLITTKPTGSGCNLEVYGNIEDLARDKHHADEDGVWNRTAQLIDVSDIEPTDAKSKHRDNFQNSARMPGEFGGKA